MAEQFAPTTTTTTTESTTIPTITTSSSSSSVMTSSTTTTIPTTTILVPTENCEDTTYSELRPLYCGIFKHHYRDLHKVNPRL
ncbi:MAG: hypothetical protein MRQ09_00595 [Candidatus Midichloria sp.]|nr:hypothetical protein [Candidatus Midichloria sp.]